MNWPMGECYIWKGLCDRPCLARDGTTTDAMMGKSNICPGKDTGLPMGKLYRGRIHRWDYDIGHLAQYRG